MSNSQGYSYVSPSAPFRQQQHQPQPSIGFKSTVTHPITNMSGYPQYPNQGGGPSYPSSGYPGYPPSVGSTYPSPYPATSNPAYPSYPSAGGAAGAGGVAYPGSNPYSTQGMSYPGAASYPQPGFNQPAGYPSAGYPPTTQPGYPQQSNPSMYPQMQPHQQPSYMSQHTGPSSYPAVGPSMGQPSMQSYGQVYPAQPPQAAPQQSYYPGGGSTLPYGTSAGGGGGYNITYGTIVPYSPFNAKTDAEVLRKAMKGLGTDEKAIIRVLCNRSAAQRAQIATEYKTLFGKDLISNLKSELSGNFEDVVCALMLPRAIYLAKCMRDAISGIGTAEHTLVEILCTSSNAEIREINAVYKTTYRSSLENDLRSDTSGYFKRLLVSMNVGNRDENPTVNQAQASHDAQRLYQAGEARWGTEESVFNSILVSQSFSQLRVVFQEYERLAHRTIEATLQNEMSGDLLQGMIAIVKCVRSRCAYFAERLRNSLKGAGTRDSTLIRIIVSRSEIDLKTIRDEYQRMFGRSLAQDVSDDTSGDYKRVLLEIIK